MNKFLRKELKGEPKQLYDAAAHLIIHGGKRLSPYLVLKSCKVLGGKFLANKAAIKLLSRPPLNKQPIGLSDIMRLFTAIVNKFFVFSIASLKIYGLQSNS